MTVNHFRGEPLTAVTAGLDRFIRFTDADDLNVVALWIAHTHLAQELYTSPRLQIDSIMPGSGKTTLLDHLDRLCHNPIQIASLSSAALIPRMLMAGPRTILLDEVDRSLRPDKPAVGDLIAVLNSGYRSGGSRPVLVPVSNEWEMKDMPTFAPVAMAGNSPQLPEDTVSRVIRILLMPDIDGTAEDSDWELIADDAAGMHANLSNWASTVRDSVRGLKVDLPAGCIGRSKEKWRPLKRVAVVAGGEWPTIAHRLIVRSLAEDAAAREGGLLAQPPGVVLLIDLHQVWPQSNFVPPYDLVVRLVAHRPDYWGPASQYGKALSEHRFGKLMAQACKVTSVRPGGRGPRGFSRVQLEPVWIRLGIAPRECGASGATG